MTLLSFAHLTMLTADCLRIYQAVRSASSLTTEGHEILKRVGILIQSTGIAHLEAGQRLDLPNLPEDAQTTSAEQIAASYRDIQLLFEDLKSAVYDLGNALLDDEQTCEQGATLFNALAAIAPDYRDIQALQRFSQHFVSACAAYARQEWTAAEKGFAASTSVLLGHQRAFELRCEACYQNGQALLEQGRWGKAAKWYRQVYSLDPSYHGGSSQVIQTCNDFRWFLDNPRLRRTLTIDTHPSAADFAWMSDRLLVATGGRECRAEVWDVLGGQRPHTLLLPTDGASDGSMSRVITYALASVREVAWSLDRRLLAVSGPLATISVWDTNTMKLLYALSGQSGRESTMAWNPNNQLLASSDGLRIKVWDARDGTLFCGFDASDDFSLAWSQDGKLLASSNVTGTIRVWDITTRQLRHRFLGHSKLARIMRWSLDNRRLVSADDDGNVRVWDATTWQLLHTLRLYRASISCMAWSPSGHLIAFGGSNTRAGLWDLISEEPIWLPGDSVLGVGWSPIGDQLVTLDCAGTVRIWD